MSNFDPDKRIETDHTNKEREKKCEKLINRYIDRLWVENRFIFRSNVLEEAIAKFNAITNDYSECIFVSIETIGGGQYLKTNVDPSKFKSKDIEIQKVNVTNSGTTLCISGHIENVKMCNFDYDESTGCVAFSFKIEEGKSVYRFIVIKIKNASITFDFKN